MLHKFTNTILLSDAVEFMSNLSPQSIDAILTDPPYGVTQDADDYIATDFLEQAYRVLKDDSALMMFVGQATLREFWNAAEHAGFRWLNTIVWHYRNTFKRERRRFAIQYDPILYFSKGNFTHNIDAVRVPYLHQERLQYAVNNKKKHNWQPNALGAICGDVWEFPAVTTTSVNGCDKPLGHKWQKPLALFERMVKATMIPSQIMLDPFCGSGTACVAARNYGCQYIGVDNDQHSVTIATKRLENPIMTEKLDKVASRHNMFVF